MNMLNVRFALVGLVLLIAGPREILSQDLVAFYPLDGDFLDYSGYANHGIKKDGGGFTSDSPTASGQAYDFNIDGGGYIEIPHAPQLELNELTLAVWIKSDEMLFETYAIAKGLENPFSLGIKDDDGTGSATEAKFWFKVGVAGFNRQFTYSETAPDGEWHFVVGTYDGSMLRFYVDGVLEREAPYTETLIIDTNPMNLGRRPVNPGRTFNGSIDDVRIYNRALSEAEIQDLYFENTIASHSVITATNSIWLKKNSQVYSGHVVVDSIGSAPFLSSDVELVVGIGATTPVGYSLYGDDIKVKKNAVVNGDLYVNSRTGIGTVNGTEYPLGDVPVITNSPPFKEGLPGTTDFIVEQNDSLSLDAGAYQTVFVRKGGTLLLTGGSYAIDSLVVKGDGRLLVNAATEVMVAGKFKTESNTEIGPVSGSSIDASDIIFYVAGINGQDGALNSTPKAAQIGLNSTLNANLYTPNGTIWLKQGTQATGSFWGYNVLIGTGVQVALNSYWGGEGAAIPSAKQPVDPILEIASSDEQPETFSLSQNYPNPFNPQTTIQYSLKSFSPVKLTVYNLLGREIETLVDGVQDAGLYEVQFDASQLSSGTYLYRLETPTTSLVRTMLLVK